MTVALVSAVIASSTSYCLHGTMADGSYTRPGSVAHNGYPLGTQLDITPSPTGRRHFVVRDRIGWGTQLDFWTPSCGQALSWGRRLVHVRRWRRPRLVGAVRGRLILDLRPTSAISHLPYRAAVG